MWKVQRHSRSDSRAPRTSVVRNQKFGRLAHSVYRLDGKRFWKCQDALRASDVPTQAYFQTARRQLHRNRVEKVEMRDYLCRNRNRQRLKLIYYRSAETSDRSG